MPGTTLITAAGMRAITDGLTAAGLNTRLEGDCCVRYVIAIAPAGSEPGPVENVEVVAGNDGYVELRWWNQPQAGPAQIIAVIVRALTALAGAGPGAVPHGQAPGGPVPGRPG